MGIKQKRWQVRIFVALIAGALLIVAIPVSIFVTIFFTSPMNPLNDWLFNHHLSEYTHVVADIKTGRIPTTNVVEKLDMNKLGYSVGRATAIFAAHCNNGTATIAFLVHGAAVGHWGYLFDDCDIPSISLTHDNGWFKHATIVPIEGHWYQFSD